MTRVKVRHDVVQPGDGITNLIPLTKGYNATVSSNDYPEISRFNWHAVVDARDGRVYAARTIGRSRAWMHRQILQCGDSGPLEVDHINGDSLDNRRCNLRLVTREQNQQNQKLRSNNRSGFIGVSRSDQKWAAHIRLGGKQIRLGTFESPEEAALAYNRRSIAERGEYGRINKISALASLGPVAGEGSATSTEEKAE